MVFQEVHAVQFTSPTTCYTGCRHSLTRFATETHSFQLLDDKNDIIRVASEPLPFSHQVCVGHDQSKSWQVFCFLADIECSDSTPATGAAEPSDLPRRAPLSSTIVDPPESSAVNTSTAPSDRVSSTTAWLVLRSHGDNTRTFEAALNYRPLSPLVCSNDENGNESSVLAWVGSADDSQLRCYVIAEDSQSLESVELSDSAFSLDSPIMVIDSLRNAPQSKETCCCMAVGCQDGSVRIISFQLEQISETVSFSHVASHTVLVDGPIIALHLSRGQDGTTRTQLLAGSMCGFVCRLEKVEAAWNGPWMVTEGLPGKDDPVLAVHALTNDALALGTHSGRCEVWIKGESDYRRLWSCLLPYSIHGLAHEESSSTELPPRLMVTTRHTFHVFERKLTRYNAGSAKRRLEDLIQSRQKGADLS